MTYVRYASLSRCHFRAPTGTVRHRVTSRVTCQDLPPIYPQFSWSPIDASHSRMITYASILFQGILPPRLARITVRGRIRQMDDSPRKFREDEFLDPTMRNSREPANASARTRMSYSPSMIFRLSIGSACGRPTPSSRPSPIVAKTGRTIVTTAWSRTAACVAVRFRRRFLGYWAFMEADPPPKPPGSRDQKAAEEERREEGRRVLIRSVSKKIQKKKPASPNRSDYAIFRMAAAVVVP